MASGLSGISVHATSPAARAVSSAASRSASRGVHAGPRSWGMKLAWVAGFAGTIIALIGLAVLGVVVSGRGPVLWQKVAEGAAKGLQVVRTTSGLAGHEEADETRLHKGEHSSHGIFKDDHSSRGATGHPSAHKDTDAGKDHDPPSRGSEGHRAANEGAADGLDRRRRPHRSIRGDNSAAHSAANDSATNSLYPPAPAHAGHKGCRGGPSAACECLLSCPVFGGRPEQCVGEDSDKSKLVDRRIQGAMGGVEDACASMQCMVACARQLDCYDAAVEKACRYLTSKADEDHCPVDCSSEGSAAEALPVAFGDGSGGKGQRDRIVE